MVNFSTEGEVKQEITYLVTQFINEHVRKKLNTPFLLRRLYVKEKYKFIYIYIKNDLICL